MEEQSKELKEETEREGKRKEDRGGDKDFFLILSSIGLIKIMYRKCLIKKFITLEQKQ